MSNAKCTIMGILNLTPDSFSDGGKFVDVEAALQHAHRMLAEGADVIDVGAESTRPGAMPLDAASEWRRLEPVLTQLCKEQIPVSVDTYKQDIMERALDLGVSMINDVKGGRQLDKAFLQRLAGYKATAYIAMHMHGEPQSMQERPLAGRICVATVQDFCTAVEDRLIQAGIERHRLYFDPGIGFGKSDAANLQLLQLCMRQAAQRQWAVGISRKGFIGRLWQEARAEKRDDLSKVLELSLMMSGIAMIRTHAPGALSTLRKLLRSD